MSRSEASRRRSEAARRGMRVALNYYRKIDAYISCQDIDPIHFRCVGDFLKKIQKIDHEDVQDVQRVGIRFDEEITDPVIIKL